MRQLLLLFILSLFLANTLSSQKLALKKGKIISGLIVNDSIYESFSLYLPSNFDLNKKWPVVYVFEMKGNVKQALRAMVPAAEQEGYILAASENLAIPFTTQYKIDITLRMMDAVSKMLPIQLNREYTAAFTNSSEFALTVPKFSNRIKGVISSDNSIRGYEILAKDFRIYYIGLVEKESENYLQMVDKSKFLNENKFTNRLIVLENKHELFSNDTFADALRTFTLGAMVKGYVAKNDSILMESYNRHLGKLKGLIADSKLLHAHHLVSEMIKMYGTHFNSDSLKSTRDSLENGDNYKAQNKIRNGMFFKEKILREDYKYYLTDDVSSLNYDNLGWWNYQIEKINKYEESHIIHERRMGKRLKKYLHRITDSHVFIVENKKEKNYKKLTYLWMLKTLVSPKEYSNYLKVISHSSKEEDYDTALFYLEELLKNGYTNRDELYSLENTALFRITPEFNELAAKYLKDARYYEIIE